MATYTLVSTGAAGDQRRQVIHVPDVDIAMEEALAIVGPYEPTVAVARGRDCLVEFLGLWNLADNGVVVWEPDES